MKQILKGFAKLEQYVDLLMPMNFIFFSGNKNEKKGRNFLDESIFLECYRPDLNYVTFAFKTVTNRVAIGIVTKE